MNKIERILENKKYHLVGKIYISADFELKSPLLIGSGESEHSDIDIIRDIPFEGESQPMIPATSIIGVFRHLFDRLFTKEQKIMLSGSNENKVDVRDALYEFFGVSDDMNDKTLKWLRYNEKKEKWNLNQSALIMRDIILDQAKYQVTQRDSVRIDPRTGTAMEHAKFDYEIVEPPKERKDGKEAPVTMTFEINLRNKIEADYNKLFKTFVGYFLQEIDGGHIRFGAKTNKGFGRLKLIPGSIRIEQLNLETADDLKKWLTNRIFQVEPEEKASNVVDINALKGGIKLDLYTKTFTIDAEFRIKNSMLVRSYSTDPKAPDVSHIQRNGHYILPGTSIMGAIRHRAWKIINTMFEDAENKKDKFYKLFGYVYTHDEYPEFPANFFKRDENGKLVIKHPARKGRVTVNETIIENQKQSIVDQIQTRIKIDRFTGGTIAGALLQELALWQKDDESVININLHIKDYTDWEPALFMFILKDLVTGDLPIGGEKSIGRGVLIGNKATVSWTDRSEPIDLEFDQSGFVIEKDQQELKKFDNFMEAWRKVREEKTTSGGDKNE